MANTHEVREVHEIHVAPDGVPTNPGTPDAPVTLERALLMARDVPRTPGGRIDVILHGGDYHLAGPLVFHHVDSGTRDCPVTWRGEDDWTQGDHDVGEHVPGEPRLLGTRVIDLEFTPTTVNGREVMVTTIPDALIAEIGTCLEGLFIDGTRYHLARFPAFPGDHEWTANQPGDEPLGHSRVSSWKDPAGGFVHGLAHHLWGSLHYRIRGKRDDGTLDLEQVHTLNRQGRLHDSIVFVENVLELLDTPGEYFYDQATGRLFVIPLPDAAFAAREPRVASVELELLPSLVEIRGTMDEPVHDITFRGITFSRTRRTVFPREGEPGWEPLGRGDWCVVRNGALLLTGASRITIEGCRFVDIGGNGVFVSNFARNIVVDRCEFAGVGESATCFVGNHDCVRSCSVGYHSSVPYDEMDMTPGPRNANHPADCTVRDCLMTGLGRHTKQVAGVFISMSSGITVSHNSIFKVPRAGICISEGAFGGHLVTGNHVFDTVRETGDHGPFNSWGRDRHWRATHASNPKRDVPENIAHIAKLDMMDREGRLRPIVIELNRFEHGPVKRPGGRYSGEFSWGIDLDDGSSNYIVRKNLTIGCSFKLREGFNRIVENNVCIGPIPPEKHQQYHGNEDIIRKNIYVNTFDTRPLVLTLNGLPEEAKEIDYNLYHSVVGTPDLSWARARGVELHSKTGDPRFVDPDNWDFRVKDDSPALALGFKNFDIGDVGARPTRFRRLALAAYRRYRAGMDYDKMASGRPGFPVQWLGATVKNLATEAEKSATGMAEITGVLIVDVPDNSMAKILGFQPSDVILQVGNVKIDTVLDLQETFKKLDESVSEEEDVQVTVFRYQEPRKIVL